MEQRVLSSRKTVLSTQRRSGSTLSTSVRADSSSSRDTRYKLSNYVVTACVWDGENQNNRT